MSHLDAKLIIISVPKIHARILVYLEWTKIVKCVPPIKVPKKRAVLITFAEGSVAKCGKSWMNVAKQVSWSINIFHTMLDKLDIILILYL